MEEMNESESLEHFTWHALKQATPKKESTELSRNVVLRIAICWVLGSHPMWRKAQK